tara:strand:- start:1347 stop:2270 length:924 start_codon:yes stop_codon:yes gene_type:complete
MEVGKVLNKSVSPYRPIRTSVELSRGPIDSRRAAPHPELRSYVAEFWQYQVHPHTDYVPVQVFPSGCVTLRFNLCPHSVESFLYGPSLSGRLKGVFYPETLVFGGAFYPERAYHLLGMAAQEVRDSRVALECIWPNSIRTVCDRLVDDVTFEDRVATLSSFLRMVLRRDLRLSADFLNVYADLHSIDLAERDLEPAMRRYRINGRTIRRHFAKYLGLGPKEMVRVIRVQRAMSALARNPSLRLCDLAFREGFSDQPHLTREFKELTGLTPKAYTTVVGHMHRKELAVWSGVNPVERHRKLPDVVRFS